ncbi:hypothetical protein FBEOM_4011 [Fusarium beomiforme]|uniref:Thioredoxin domain-containing protein n=1 Tax=Fusarium beomiforme TaxID=44412 RepID=A0A9P5ANQ4_9HYPO|nr:hypothetical protein FBEOM_4011 [Fusarium beomiforme]
MTVTEIKSKDGYQQLIKNYKLVIINAYVSWAGPSITISPHFEKLSNQMPYNPKKLVFAKLNIDELPDLADEIGVQSVPTFFVYRDGVKKETILMPSPERLKKMVIACIDQANEPE